jgi:hypothetical protein
VRPRALAPLLAAALAVAACADGGDDDATSRPEPTERPSTTTTTSAPPTTTTTLGVRLDPGREATAACGAVPAATPPDPRRPRYRLDMALDLGAGTVTGTVAVRFRPDLPTDRLVFRLWPNGGRSGEVGARLDAGAVTIDGGPPVPGERPDPTTLVVPLGRTLPAGEVVEASLPWTLVLPGAAEDRISRSGDAVRLGSFFPILPWEPGVGWAVDPATGIFGESSTAPTADFDWALAVPPGLTVLGTGEQEGDRWRATAVRDVGISVGRFRTVEATANAPEPVRVVVGVHEGLSEDPATYRDRVVRALEDFAVRFGWYPWRTFSLALTPVLPGGIEYPAHVMQGPDTIGRTTPHEVGHQWFYSLVGNDQGRDPVLDEALATWAEVRADGNVGELDDVDVPADAEGRAGAPMTYWDGHRSSYYRGVYVQGAQALAALGDADGVDCALRQYVARGAFGIARQADLIDALATRFPDAAATLDRYGVVAAPR